VKNRRVNYGPIDPLASRELFLQQGLVEGEYETGAPFRDHNRRVMADVLQLAAKTRRRELVVDVQKQYDFFAAKLPADVFDGQSFERWRRQAERSNARLLYLRTEDLVDLPDDPSGEHLFPNELHAAQLRLQLHYHFEPGTERDGVTLRVPREGVNQLHAEKLGWLVPGMLEEKIVALIRTLPKQVRRNLIPAPDVARRVRATLTFGEGPFFTLLAERLSVEAGEPIRPGDFHEEQIPQHLRLNIEVCDESGKLLASGRDLHELRRTLRIAPTNEVAATTHSFHRDGVTQWDFGDFPEQITLERGGLSVTVYPTLVDRGSAVALRLYDAQQSARTVSHFGLLRLFAIAAMKELRAQVAWFPEIEKLRVYAATLPPARDFRDELLDLLAARSFVEPPWPRSLSAFQERLAEGVRRLPGVVYDVSKLLQPLLQQYHEATLALEKLTGPNFTRARDDAREQLVALTQPGFLTHIPWGWLEHYPRYFQAISVRMRKLTQGGLSRDTQALSQLEPLLAKYKARAQRHAEFGTVDAELEQFRWMLEELRVSLFAQELGTSLSISMQRMEKQWQKVRET
jgi:ATP-dependent helicase HrpA